MASVAPSGVLSVNTVDVRIVNGTYRPCNTCHWYSACVVPKGACLQNINLDAVRNLFQCQDYTARKPTT